MRSNHFPHRLRRRSTPHALLSALVLASLLLSSCSPLTRWNESSDPGPEPPVAAPALPSLPLGTRVARALTPEPTPTQAATPAPTPAPTATPTRTPTPTPTLEPIEPLSLEQAQECLAAGKVLYALALQNTNVRDAAGTNACRVGRVPKGSLIRLSAAPETAVASSEPVDESAAVASAEAVTPESALSAAAASAPAATFPDGAALPNGAVEQVEPTTAPTATPTATPTAAPVEPAEPLPPQIGYTEDVQPVFVRICNVCHSQIAQTKGLMVTTYEGLMKGSLTGPVVLPGDPINSLLWQMLETKRMPLVGTLTPAELATIHDWIEAGAPEFRPPLPTPKATAAPALPTDGPPSFTAGGSGSGATPSNGDAPFTTPTPAVRTAAAAIPAPAAGERSGDWLQVNEEDYSPVDDGCATTTNPPALVSSDLILPVACGVKPQLGPLNDVRVQFFLPLVDSEDKPAMAAAPIPAAGAAVTTTAAAGASSALSVTAATTATDALTTSAPVAAQPLAPAYQGLSGGATGISAPVLGIGAPSDADGWMTPRGGLCVQNMLPDHQRGITALAFAPDGRLFLGLDSSLTGNVDPLVLYDAYHPSRSVAVLQPGNTRYEEIFVESSRITGMDWEGGTLYLTRAGEVGRIVDGGKYEALAGGFAVNSQLFHANNGIVISGGWAYVSAGGVIDGYSDGPIVGIGEDAAQAIVSGGNPYAARIVRAPLDALNSSRSINAFSTAARGTRNPYGITVDPAGNIWFTDNGATNLPEEISAGDEVDMLNPASIGGSEGATPYYGFPLALTGAADWYAKPAVVLPNAGAPTGIAWAMGTIYFSQYGVQPGLYRIGVDGGGALVAERVLLGWPILALATAPDGALWVGMGDGGLYRVTGGCG